MADPAQHKRFLDYRDLHVYFGSKKPPLVWEAFQALDNEYRALATRTRDDEDEARFEELASILHRD